MRKVLLMFLILVFPHWVYADNLYHKTPNIADRLSPFRAPVSQNKPVIVKIKKVSRLIVVDIPLLGARRTVDINRIKENNINAGTALSPWETEVNFTSITPELIYSSKNIHGSVAGGIMKGQDGGSLRKGNFVDASFQSSIWMVLMGVDGFMEKEKVFGTSAGIQFLSNFSRTTAGGRGWLGLKLGDFSSDFIAVRYGRGYIRTAGDILFISPSIQNIQALPLYDEEFFTETVSAAGKISVRFFTAGLLVENNAHSRILNSPDPLRFGWNEFRDLKAEGTVELIPLPKKDFARLLIRGTRYLESRDGLLFRNQAPELQVFLRIKFK